MKKHLLYVTAICTPLTLAAPAFSATQSWSCGDKCTATLDDNGKMTISGTGAMTEYAKNADVPWASVASKIKTAEIDSGITSITRAFNGASALESVTFKTDENGHSNLTSIGALTFQNASSLTNINIPSSVTSIGKGAFNKASSLETVNIPEGVTSLGQQVFYQTALKNVTIPSTVETIGLAAFQDISALENVTFTTDANGQTALTSIGDQAFAKNASLTNIIIPKTVETIGQLAFGENSSLANVTFATDENGHSALTSIGDGIFQNATSLTNIDIPSGVTSIGQFAFNGATSLENVTFATDENGHSALTSIGKQAFAKNYALTEIDLPDGLQTIGVAAFAATSLKSVELPDSVTSIGDYAFEQAYERDPYLTNRIESIVLSENLEHIGTTAFSRNKFTSIVLPASLFEGDNTLSPYAFMYTNISTIYCPQGNTKCLNYVAMTCEDNGNPSSEKCVSTSRPLDVQPQIMTYRKDSVGNYILNGNRYSSFSDMALERNPQIKRKIYTVEEAMEATKNGDKFHVFLTYK